MPTAKSTMPDTRPARCYMRPDNSSASPALHKSRSACEAGVRKAREAGDSIKPGAQAPGSDHKKQARARETGDRVKFTGFRPLSRAPTFYWYLNLGLAPQALCLCLLSQAKKHHSSRLTKDVNESFWRLAI